MLNYLPHFEAAAAFADSVAAGTPNPKTLAHPDVDPTTIVPVLFGFLAGLDEAAMVSALEPVKEWLARYSQMLQTLAERHGDAGARLASLVP
jgi:hypothetical protein